MFEDYKLGENQMRAEKKDLLLWDHLQAVQIDLINLGQIRKSSALIDFNIGRYCLFERSVVCLEINLSPNVTDMILLTFGSVVGKGFPQIFFEKIKKYQEMPKKVKMLFKHVFCFLDTFGNHFSFCIITCT